VARLPSIDFDHVALKLTCPRCEEPVNTTYGDARQNKVATCANGHEIQLRGEDLNRAMREVNQSLDDFKRSIEEMNRRNRRSR
jgi:hypothetical protein